MKRTILFKLSILRKIKKYLPHEVRLTYYNYFVKPHFDYCCSIWGNCNQGEVDKMIKLQKMAARLIMNADYSVPSIELFQKLNWKSFKYNVQFHQAMLVYKSLNHLAPSYMYDMFKLSEENTSHRLRSASTRKLFIPRAHKNSIRHKGPAIWNSLSNATREASTLNQFKHNYV